MRRLLVGVLLLPLAAALSWAAAKSLAGVAVGASAAGPFISGLALAVVSWIIARHAIDPAGPAGGLLRAARWFYVLGHELTHALAAWASGGDVFAISVGERGGHVDLSESSVVVALAPYCVPFHALLVVLGYRVLLWLKPGAQADVLFLLLLGAALAFHGFMTYETLADARQPDLAAAGGRVFSLAIIACVNGLLLLVLLKALFPETVSLWGRLRESGGTAWWFWTKAWTLALPTGRRLARRYLP